MDYGLLKFFHILGAVLMGGGLIGVWMSDLRASIAGIAIVLGGSSQYRGLLRRPCRPRRSVAAVFRHLDDCKVLRRVEFLTIALARGHGRVIRLRIYRGQYDHPSLFYATAPPDQISA
jgi:hypothetical protein